MTEKPFGPDFLFTTIKDVHFGSGPHLIVYATIGAVGQQSDTGGNTVSFPFPAMSISQAPFSLSSPITPDATFSYFNSSDGSGTASLTIDGPWSRVGTPQGATPSDIIAKDSAFKAWLGQYVTTGQFSQGPAGGGGGVSFGNIDGYAIIDLSKIGKKGTLKFHVVGGPTTRTSFIAVASYKSNQLKQTKLQTDATNGDQIAVTLTNGTVDQMPNYNAPFGASRRPAHCVSYADAISASGPGRGTDVTVTCDLASLAVTATDHA